MRNAIVTILSLAIILLVGCTSNTPPKLKGFYQTEKDVNGYFVQLSIQQDDQSFVEYISNREVNRGTYEIDENGKYLMTGNKQSFEITLNDDNSFDIIVKKLNEGNPIKMINIGGVPVTFPAIFDDEEEYKTLIDE